MHEAITTPQVPRNAPFTPPPSPRARRAAAPAASPAPPAGPCPSGARPELFPPAGPSPSSAMSLAAANAAAMEGRALLGMARDNRPDDIRAAAALGVPVDWPNPIGQTALMIASLWGNLEAMKVGVNVGKR